MPTLPTLTVTEPQETYILSIFGTWQDYEDWLKESITHAAYSKSNNALQIQFEIDLADGLTAVESALDW